MKKQLLLLALLLATVCAPNTMQAQSKLDLTLQRAARKAMTARETNAAPAKVQYVKVSGALNEGESVPTEALERLGIKVDHTAFGVVTMRVPATSLFALDSLSQFRLYEAPSIKHLSNRLSRKVEHVDEMQDSLTALSNGLPHTYTGRGVIVGVFDTGIDFNHVNYRDSAQHTRIKEAMLFRKWADANEDGFVDKDGNPLAAKDIVERYTNPSDIDTLTTDAIFESHGTHTSSTLGGSYAGDYLDKNGNVVHTDLRAAAYQSDLILSGSPFLPNDFLQYTLDEMDQYAKDAGKPLVVSLSIGNNGGWMDGKTANDQMYEDFTKCGERPGRVVCMSAGNEGYDAFTINEELNEENDYSVWTFLSCRNYADGDVSTQMKIYNNTSDSLAVEYYVYNYEDVMKANTRQDLPEPAKHVTKEGFQEGFYLCGKDAGHDNRFALFATIIEDEPITDNDEIAVHIYSPLKKACKPRIFCMSENGQYTRECYALGMEDFTDGDNTSSFNSDACNKGLLSVGAWSATNNWVSYFNPEEPTYYPTSYVGNKRFPVGDICRFSSFALADDNGIARPDFCAPGMGVISGFNVRDTTRFVNGERKGPGPDGFECICGVAREELGRQDNLRSWIGRMQGTSMSCPNAASVIALWLQACPTLTQNQIREIVRETADRDTFVTVRHPARFGAGKINALKGLQYILTHYQPTEIRNLDAQQPVVPVRKLMEDGRIVIEKDGRRYSTTGQRIL